jgi:hypothetical protein
VLGTTYRAASDFDMSCPSAKEGEAVEAVEGSYVPRIDIFSNQCEHDPWLSSILLDALETLLTPYVASSSHLSLFFP